MNLLLTGCFSYTASQINLLEELGYKLFFMKSEKYDMLPLPAAEVEAVVCNYLFTTHDFADFTGCKLIQLTSAGLDRVPVEDIRKRGCLLFNARGVYSSPMAEWALFRVLEHYKQGWFFRKEQDAVRWTKHRGLREIAGTKVAVVGAGSVGQAVAKAFRGLGAETTGFDIHTHETEYFDAMFLTETLSAKVSYFDVVVVTAPLLPSTVGLISREVMLAMKPGGVLVNISRGGVVNQQALCEVLTERRDLFAALDVFENEPLDVTSPLWKMENVAISPHNSFVSDGNNARMFSLIYHNLRRYREESPLFG